MNIYFSIGSTSNSLVHVHAHQIVICNNWRNYWEWDDLKSEGVMAWFNHGYIETAHNSKIASVCYIRKV